MKNPRFEIHKKDGTYQWYLKHSNRKTLAQGRPKGFKSVKGCVDSMEVVRKILNEADILGEFHRTDPDIFYVGCTGPKSLKRGAKL